LNITLRHAIAALATGLLTVTTAHAADGSAALTNVHVRVIDLDPLDGITAEVTFVNGFTSVQANGYYATGPLGAALGPFTGSLPNQTASVQTTAGDLLAGPGWSASASASAFGAGASSLARASQSASFTLTANTLLVITADAPSALGTMATGENVESMASLDLLTEGGAISGHAGAFFSSYWVVAPSRLQATLANLDGHAIDGTLLSYVQVQATGAALPVPEPQSAALLLGGLAAVGVAVRRRAAR